MRYEVRQRYPRGYGSKINAAGWITDPNDNSITDPEQAEEVARIYSRDFTSSEVSVLAVGHCVLEWVSYINGKVSFRRHNV